MSFPQPLENRTGQLSHASSEAQAGAYLELDSSGFAPVRNAGWADCTDLIGRIVLGSVSPRPNAVDECFYQLIGAGHRALQPPYDAFWGARYAIVEDPDGIAIGLTSPVDPNRQTQPPAEWTG